MSDASIQFILNASSSAMDHGDQLIRQMLVILAQEAWRGELDPLLARAVNVRRELQKRGEEARAAANDAFNSRKRAQRQLNLPSIRDVGCAVQPTTALPTAAVQATGACSA